MSETEWFEGLTEWEGRWDEGRIGFHRAEVNDKLVRHAEVLLAGAPQRVLVPLCGKSVDLLWLEAQGVLVVGVELVPKAIASFFEENDRVPEVSEIEGITTYTSGNITLVQADFLEVSTAQVGTVDAIYDRAALVAVTPDVRARYVAQLLRLLRPGGRMLLFSYDMPVAPTKGPPFRLPIDDVPALFQRAASVELLEKIDHTQETEPKLAQRGVEWSQEGAFLIQR